MTSPTLQRALTTAALTPALLLQFAAAQAAVPAAAAKFDPARMRAAYARVYLDVAQGAAADRGKP